jgi:hypothetical protein
MKDSRSAQFKEAWVLCFILGIIMLNYPFIHIFNKETMIFGIPALVLYLLVGWPVSILVIYLFTRHLGNGSGRDDAPSGKDKGKQPG